MVVAGREEHRGVPVPLRHVEAEGVRVGRLGPGEVRRFEVDVSHVGPVRDATAGVGSGLGRRVREIGEVQRQRVDADSRPLARPRLGRRVAVDLHAVPLRVAAVERLAHDVVRGAGELPPRLDARERRPERGPRGHAEGDVEQARLPAAALRRVGRGPKVEQVAVGRPERRPVAVAFAEGQADHVAVERDRVVEVGDAERHASHPRRRREFRVVRPPGRVVRVHGVSPRSRD